MKKTSLKTLLAAGSALALMGAPAFAADLDVEEKEYVEVGSFGGSILLPGTGISFKVGGYTKADYIFTFDDFAPGGGQGAAELLLAGGGQFAGTGGDRVRFHALQSRLNFDARTTTDLGSARAFLEVDLFNVGGNEAFSNSANPRLRHAFIQLGIGEGTLTAGQTWTNFGDLNSYANTLDFNGPNAQSFQRQAQLRWTQPLTDAITVSVSAENPEFLGAASGPDNGFDTVPDFTFALKAAGDFGTFHFGAVGRYLDVDNSANPALSTDTAFGYGFQLAGTFNLGDSTTLGAQVNYGDGIGRYIQFGPPPVSVTAAGNLSTVRAIGALAWIQHKWTSQLQSNIVGGWFRNLDATRSVVAGGQVVDIYAAANVIYSLRSNINIGAELSYARALFRSGVRRTDGLRLQSSVQFTF